MFYYIPYGTNVYDWQPSYSSKNSLLAEILLFRSVLDCSAVSIIHANIMILWAYKFWSKWISRAKFFTFSGVGRQPFAISTKSTFAGDTCTFGEGKSVEEEHEVVKQIEGH